MTALLVVLLLLVLAGERILYIQAKRYLEAATGKEDNARPLSLLIGSAGPVPDIPPAVPLIDGKMSGFSDSGDFLAHARRMESRAAATPVKKLENMIAENDHAQRKMRSTLIRGG